MGKVLKRSFEILSNVVKDTGKEYTSNLTSLINDARTVQNTLVKSSTDASDTLARLKSSNVTKKISDWFYGEESSFESSGDDFDPGFKVESSGDAQLDGDEKPRELNVESMTDISNKQSATVVKVGRRQAEQSVANTAEIVSCINSRSSEMITAINNINKTLISINSNVEKIIQLQTAAEPEEQKEIDKGGLFSDGQLSLGRIFEASKNSVKNNTVVSSASMFMQMMAGGAGPEDIAKMGLSFLTDKKFDALGGRSIDEIGKGINEAIGTATQSVLNEMISSKGFKKFFGDITSFEGDKDYGTLVANHYDKKKAVFDGMTRETIVNIIPEYLSLINESISGIKYHVDNSGKLVKGPRKNEFKEVANNAFSSSGISTAASKSINTTASNLLGNKFKDEDIELAGKALTSMIVHDLHEHGTRNISTSELKDSMSKYIPDAVETLCALKNDPDYWARLCQVVLLQVTSGIGNSQKFIQNINQSLQNMMDSAVDFAQSGKANASQAGRITKTMIQSQFVKEHSSYIEKKDDKSKPKVDGKINKSDKPYTKYTTNEYLNGIFGILNRGVNVKVVQGGKKRYSSWKIRTDPERQTESDDDTFGKSIAAQLSGAKNDKSLIKTAMEETVKAVTGQNDKNNESGGGKKGFLSGLLNSVMQGGMAGFTNQLFSGGLSKLTGEGSFLGGIIGKGKSMLGDAKSKFDENIKGANPLKYDKRAQQKAAETKDMLKENVDNLANKFNEVVHNAIGKVTGSKTYDKARRAAGNVVYKKDEKILNTVTGAMDNFDQEMIEGDKDKWLAKLVFEAYGKEDYDEAEKFLKQMDNGPVKTLLSTYISEIKRITSKRNKGESIVAKKKLDDIDPEALSELNKSKLVSIRKCLEKGKYNFAKKIADGMEDSPEKAEILEQIDILEKTAGEGTVVDSSEQVSVGSVVQDVNTDENRNALDVIKEGFSKVTSVLGKIAKFVVKIAEDGMRNIKFGLQSMKEGLFGGGDSKGIIPTIAVGMPKAIAKGVSSGGKKLASKIGDMAFSRFAKQKDADGNVIKDENGKAKLKTTREVLQGMTFSSRYKRNADGTVARDENNKKQTENEMSVYDALKNPIKALKTSLGNISADISQGGKNLGKKFKGIAKSIADSKVGQLLKGLADKVKSALGTVGGWAKKGVSWAKDKLKPKENGLGSKIMNSSFMKGATSGFKKAKAKADEAKKKQSIAQAREENPLQADMTDAIEGKKESIFSKIHDVMTGIASNLGLIKEDIEDEDANVDENNTTDTDTETPSTPDAGSVGTTEGSDATPTTDTGGASVGSVTESTTTTTPAADAGGGEGGGKGGIAGLLGDLGKTMGGFTQALLGIGQLILSIVMSMEGVKALQDLVMSILTDGLQPLNAIFEALIELVKPIVAILKDTVTMLADTVTIIAKALIDAIQPIMQALQPIIETILGILTPILDIITVLLDVVMVPIMMILQAIQPVIELCGAVLQIISGVLQVSMGIVIGLLGAIVMGIGGIMKLVGSLPGLGSLGKSGDQFFEQGKQMVSTGKSMVIAGMDQMKQGMEGMLSSLQKLVMPLADHSDDEEEKEDDDVDTSQVKLGNEFGAGDVNTSTVNNSWSYTYGSGNSTMNQHSYGNYMNMGERGCGPVVLADAYSRRTGGRVNPANLAAGMAGSGNYDPRRGTSVSSMVNTGSAMGMGMRVGGVTQSSLKQASPSNPITLLGSGTGFGTKSGNNHYVNVIGTDRHGGAYVANPMSGRVERQSATALTLNSKLGLYGSGDSDLEEYGFNDETIEAFDKLKNITSQLTEMFTGKGKSDEVSDRLKANEDEIKAKEIKKQLGQEEYDKIKQQAMDQLKSENPKRDGESDEEYEARIDKLFGKKGNNLIVQLGGQAAYDKGAERNQAMIDAAGEVQKGYDSLNEGLEKVSLSDFESSSSVSGSSVLGAEMAPFSPIINTETNIDKATSDKSPVHDYFAATSGAAFGKDDERLSSIQTLDSGWYGKSSAPVSKEGVGSTGNDSEAVVINAGSSDTVRAITGGTVTYVTRGGKHGNIDPNGGLGNSIKWRDTAGMYHWYFHLGDIAKGVEEGTNIEPNQELGTFGNTGMTGRDEKFNMLRYMVTKSGPKGSTGDEGHINPLTYWKFEESDPNQGEYSKTDSMTGGFWGSIYEQKFAGSKYHEEATKAGLTGAQEAMIAAIGIHEDGAKKLVGEKSLTKVTADYNGQTAFGIMNWIPDSPNRYVGAEETKYGSTLAEQLPIMRKMYFDKEPSHDRARIIQSNFNQYSTGIQTALGHAPKLKPGDAWGPLAETDLPESMGHYVANALIPAGWDTAAKLGAHMETAIDAYNWMVKQGWIKVGSSNGSAEDNARVTGRFVSTVTNPTSMAGNTGDLIEAASQVWEAYTNKVPAGTYAHTNKGPVTTRSGVTLEHVHPDCSGMLSATMNYMGYTFDPNKSTAKTCDKYRWCTYDIVGKTGNDGFILGPDGQPSNDWVFKDFDPNDMQEGDIITTQEHVGMYIQPGSDSYNALGFDAGNGDRTAVVGPGQAKAYLDGDPNWRSKLQWTMGPSYSGLRTTLRYVGSKEPSSTVDGGAGANEGGFTGGGALGYTNAVYPKPMSKNDSAEADREKGFVGPMPSKVNSNSSTKNTPNYSIWDPSTWGNVKGSDKTRLIYEPLAKNHKIAVDAGGPYYDEWSRIRASDSKKNKLYNVYGDDPAYWREMGTLYKNNKEERSSIQEQLKDLKYFSGSGDIEIPPLDMSKFVDEYDTGNNSSPIIVNRYEIQPDNSKDDQFLDKMGKMTFNVRAKRVEQLLEKLIEIVDDKNNNNTQTTDTGGGSMNLFTDHSIPEPVVRLSRG